MKVYNRRILSMVLALGFTVLPISKAFSAKTKNNKTKAIVTIFNDDNIASKQYGANQRVFKRNFDELINDPYIWEEMQKYYPEKNFSCHDEALAFYKSYFKIIYDCGCGYAVACDAIFKCFEGHEKQFEKTFGYPMYTKDENGSIDFNYEILMLEFFNYSVLSMQNYYGEIEKATKKDMYEYELDHYARSKEFLRKKPENMEENKEWEFFDKSRKKRYLELYKRWMDEPVYDINLGISVDGAFGYLYIFLANHHLNSDIKVSNSNKYQAGDIIAGGGFHIYKSEEDMLSEDEFHSYKSKIGDHYYYVTEVTSDGQVIVSSWGEKYILDPIRSDWNEKVLIKVNRK